MVELPPLDGVNVSRFVVTLLLTSLTCLGIGRLVRAGWQRRLARMVEDGRSLRLGSAAGDRAYLDRDRDGTRGAAGRDLSVGGSDIPRTELS